MLPTKTLFLFFPFFSFAGLHVCNNIVLMFSNVAWIRDHRETEGDWVSMAMWSLFPSPQLDVTSGSLFSKKVRMHRQEEKRDWVQKWIAIRSIFTVNVKLLTVAATSCFSIQAYLILLCIFHSYLAIVFYVLLQYIAFMFLISIRINLNFK